MAFYKQTETENLLSQWKSSFGTKYSFTVEYLSLLWEQKNWLEPNASCLQIMIIIQKLSEATHTFPMMMLWLKKYNHNFLGCHIYIPFKQYEKMEENTQLMLMSLINPIQLCKVQTLTNKLEISNESNLFVSQCMFHLKIEFTHVNIMQNWDDSSKLICIIIILDRHKLDHP